MADNLKPYDPNKGFISFRLNPDAIKEELISFVPYNRTLRHIYNNPEGDIRETVKVAASETPILGSLLAGEPIDAAKEAILFGAPIPKPAKAKAKIAKFKPGTEFGSAKGYNDLILVKEPGSRKYKAYGFDEETGDFFRYRNSAYEGPSNYFNNAIKETKPMNAAELSKGIDYTNAMFEKAPALEDKNPVAVANSDIGVPSEAFGEYGIEPSYAQPYYNPLGRRIDAYNRMDELYDKVSKAKPRRGEQVMLNVPTTERVPMDNVVLYNPKTKQYRHPGFNDYGNVYSMETPLRPVPDKNVFDFDKKLLQDDINQRNVRVDFDEDVIPYNSAKQYYNDYKQAYNDYVDALYGPFLEDIGTPNRTKLH